MSKIGFNKDLKKSCEYCRYGTVLEFTNETICKKRGVTDKTDSCRSYKYDPLKRVPQKIKIANDFTEADFKL